MGHHLGVEGECIGRRRKKKWSLAQLDERRKEMLEGRRKEVKGREMSLLFDFHVQATNRGISTLSVGAVAIAITADRMRRVMMIS